MFTSRMTAMAVATAGAMLVAVPSALAFQDHAGSFTDDDGDVHEANIEAIFDAGVTDGCNPPGNDDYCPELDVTRAEMASFIARALELDHADPTPFGNETCDPAYFPCVPTVEEVGDLDCDEIREEYPEGVDYDSDFPDSHNINQDGDAEACELAA